MSLEEFAGGGGSSARVSRCCTARTGLKKAAKLMKRHMANILPHSLLLLSVLLRIICHGHETPTRAYPRRSTDSASLPSTCDRFILFQTNIFSEYLYVTAPVCNMF